MFPHPLRKSGSHPVKGSEAKKLLASLRKTYPLLSEDQAREVYTKARGLSVTRLPNRYSIYSTGEDVPVFYVPDERVNRPVPSLYLLHLAPQILPQVVVYQGVGKKLLGGADLFMPGVKLSVAPETVAPGRSWVTDNFGPFHKLDLCAVVEEGAWFPVALGRWLVSSSDLEYQGLKGRAVEVLHHLDDGLWRLGPETVPTELPASAGDALAEHAAGVAQAAADAEDEQRARAAAAAAREEAAFLAEAPKMVKRKEKQLRAIEQLRAAVASGAVVPDRDQEAKLSRGDALRTEIADISRRLDALLNPPPEVVEEAVTGPGAGDDAEVAEGEPTTAAAAAAAADDPETNAGGGGDVPAGAEGAEEEATPAAAAAAEEPPGMDEVLVWALLLALHTTVTDKALPLLASALYAQHVLPASRRLRYGVEISVKKSRFKKMGAFLAHCQELGLLRLFSERVGVDKLVGVDRLHDLYLGFDPGEHLQPEGEDAEDGDGDGGVFSTAAAAGGYRLPKSGTKVIVIQQAKVKGNKNVTLVKNLVPFGIAVDDGLKKEIAKRFSVAVSLADNPNLKQGPTLKVQGKYAHQLQSFLADKFRVPPRLFRLDAKGVSKKDRAIRS